MPPNSDEPEKYSLDDMMDRLQAKPDAAEGDDENGRLVTRADGTQAIKVRKRKRRSKQPHKEAAKRATRIRIVQIAAGVTLLVGAVMALGATVVYINSSAYRAGVVSKFNTSTGADTELLQFRANPAASDVVRANFRWPEGNILKFLTVVDVHAKGLFGGMAGSRWSVDEVSASSATLHLDSPHAGEPLRSVPASAGKPPVAIGRLAVTSLDIAVGDPVTPALQVLKTEASFYPEATQGGRPVVRLFRGDVKMPGWPDLRLNRAHLEFNGPQTEIITLRLLHGTDNTGAVDLSGKLDAYALDKNQSLDVKLDSFSLSGITGPSLGKLLNGRVNTRNAPGSNKLTFSQQAPGGTLSIAFSAPANGAVRLYGFPFLSILSQATGDPWYIEPSFDDGCSGTLTREKGVIQLNELTLDEKHHLSVIGNLKLEANDALSGTLELGLPEPILNSSHTSLKKAFTESRNGLRWATIQVSGTGLRPKDNFREIYQGEAAEAKKPSSGSAFDELTNPGK